MRETMLTGFGSRETSVRRAGSKLGCQMEQDVVLLKVNDDGSVESGLRS